MGKRMDGREFKGRHNLGHSPGTRSCRYCSRLHGRRLILPGRHPERHRREVCVVI